jgi:hypothetical protein
VGENGSIVYSSGPDVYTKDEIDIKLKNLNHLSRKVVADLDEARDYLANNDDGDQYIYLVPSDTVIANDSYDEYVAVLVAGVLVLEKVGTWKTDLSNYATIEDVFTVEGDGTMEVDGSGTGAMVYVKDLDGNVVATYVAIFFGDVSGDGEADGTDMSFINYHAAWMLTDDLGINDTELGRLLPHYAFAGDVNVDGDAEGTDMSLIDYHAAWMLEADGLSNEDLRFDIAAIISRL